MDVDVGPRAKDAAEVVHLQAVQVDEVVLLKRWLGVDGDHRATFHFHAGRLGKMDPGPSKGIDVNVVEARIILSGQDGGIRLGVVPDDVELIDRGRTKASWVRGVRLT